MVPITATFSNLSEQRQYISAGSTSHLKCGIREKPDTELIHLQHFATASLSFQKQEFRYGAKETALLTQAGWVYIIVSPDCFTTNNSFRLYTVAPSFFSSSRRLIVFDHPFNLCFMFKWNWWCQVWQVDHYSTLIVLFSGSQSKHYQTPQLWITSLAIQAPHPTA